MLQARFGIVLALARLFQIEKLKDIITVFIILQNMIVEDVRYINGVESVDYMSNSMQLPVSQYHILVHLNLWTLFDFIVALETEKLILNSNHILLSTCCNYIAIFRIL